jgi:hypothetical protein
VPTIDGTDFPSVLAGLCARREHGGTILSIDERLRLNIHTKLTELLVSDEADAFMAHMLPVHWHDVATKDDLRVFSAELRAELRADIVGQTRWLTGYVTALGAVMLAVASLLF